MAIKDIGLSVAAGRPKLGSRLAEGLRFETDSDLMTRFRKTGVTAIGRTAIPEMAVSITTEPVSGGPTRNPWTPARSAGGSSGGAAAAVSAGIVPIDRSSARAAAVKLPCCTTCTNTRMSPKSLGIRSDRAAE